MLVTSTISARPPTAGRCRCIFTEKGQEVSKVVNDLYHRQLKSLQQVGGLAPNDLETLNKALIRLERFWTDQIRYQL